MFPAKKTEVSGQDVSVGAATALLRFRFVELIEGMMVIAGGNNSNKFPLGVALLETRPGDQSEVRVSGTSRLYFSDSVAVGDFVKAGPDGIAVKASPGDLARGVCLVKGDPGHAGAALLVLTRV